MKNSTELNVSDSKEIQSFTCCNAQIRIIIILKHPSNQSAEIMSDEL